MTDLCPDRELALQAMLDGELDPLATAALEDHVRGCTACREALAQAEQLRLTLRSPGLHGSAPLQLRARIESLAGARRVRPGSLPHRNALPWLGGGAIGALAASLALLLVAPATIVPPLADEVLSGQIRSLQTGHLVDVATSDRHTVKPWFNGRIDYSPPVVDLAQRGFPLVGGRLDVLEGRTVAALVFKRRLHTINLYVRPQPASGRDAAMQREGYSLQRWTSGGLEYWAVSDIPPEELEQFRRAFEDEAHR